MVRKERKRSKQQQRQTSHEVMGSALYLHAIPPKTQSRRLIMRKTGDKPTLRSSLQKTQEVLLKTVKVMKKQQILRNYYNWN
jgi:hypothetical protein